MEIFWFGRLWRLERLGLLSGDREGRRLGLELVDTDRNRDCGLGDGLGALAGASLAPD